MHGDDRLWCGRGLLVALIALGSWEAVAGEMPSLMLSGAKALADVRLARRALETIHPGYARYTDVAVLDRVWEELEADCETGITRRDLFGRLSTVLAKIRCSHTKAEPAQSWAEWRATAATYFPFRFDTDGRRMVVTASATEQLQPGDEIAAIDGRPITQVLSRLMAVVPADGFTDASRTYGLGNVSDLDDCEFDHFYPYFFPYDTEVRLEVRPDGQQVARTSTTKLLKKAERDEALDLSDTDRNFDESVRLIMLDNGIAVLRIGTFVAYRNPISPVKVLRPVFEQIQQAGVRCLILDLRNCGGGSDSAALALRRFVSPKPFIDNSRRWVRIKRLGEFDSLVETWDRSLFERSDDRFRKLDNGYYELVQANKRPRKPLEPAFRGKLIALTSPANASGATLFLASIRDQIQATLVGEPTGGSVEGPTAGVILFLELPESGIRVRIPVIRTITGIDNPPGQGVLPDVVVEPTIEDRLAGRDPVLDTALRIARDARPSS